ncbi:unnamed protein product [Clonostachys rosea]|uniref:Fatty acid desaturase domain-containing protein n=1 Tax=Bionectria ochroleuca TaxID=29856 RepID=A0ABY6U900_BIOOC|nr:unnamed protein product [Clonostachys rosea]
MEHIVYDPALTKADRLVLQNLAADIGAASQDSASSNCASPSPKAGETALDDESVIDTLNGFNNPKDARFEPTVITSVDADKISISPLFDTWIVPYYIRIARSLVRVETDVLVISHLFLYFTTSIPSVLYLFHSFTWLHGVLHLILQFSYVGTYTLMMHQHIHMRGVLAKHMAWLDHTFPYVLDPLMGHTWNSYFYHHVKHHHIEGNGPNDLSSTLRYERDNIFHFLHYVGRFFFLIWVDLPTYFIRNGKYMLACKAAFWELANYTAIYLLFRYNPRATFFALLLPLLLLRIGLMVGNWGQHAFVDRDDPDSDYRSSITLIDVPSNRHCFNDGYHTSHHLNPLRHWRQHPVAFLKGKQQYASQHALVFHNIDYLMMTVRLMLRDYETLAKCMVPLGDHISLTLEERAALLKRNTRPFTEEEIRAKYPKLAKN